MLKVYVTEQPNVADNCPFYGKTNKKCNISNDKCCLAEQPNCEHLITLNFGFEEVADEQP